MKNLHDNKMPNLSEEGESMSSALTDSRQQCRGVFPCNNSFAQLNIGASKACPTPGMPFLLSLSGRLQTNMFFYRRSKMPLQRRVANCWLKARIIVILRLDKRR